MEISLYCHQIAKMLARSKRIILPIVVKVALHILRLTIRAIVQIKQEKKTMQQNALSHFLLIGAFRLNVST